MRTMVFAAANALGRAVRELRRLADDESGQDLVEYALILVCVALAAMASMQSLTSAIAGVFNSVGNVLTSNT